MSNTTATATATATATTPTPSQRLVVAAVNLGLIDSDHLLDFISRGLGPAEATVEIDAIAAAGRCTAPSVNGVCVEHPDGCPGSVRFESWQRVSKALRWLERMEAHVLAYQRPNEHDRHGLIRHGFIAAAREEATEAMVLAGLEPPRW